MFSADISSGLLLSIGLGLLAFAALIEWPLRRLRAAKFAVLAEQFETLRRLAESDRRHVPLDSGRPAPAEGYSRAAEELAGLGFVAHGDLEEVGDDGTAYGIARWFIGAEGSVVAWFAQVSAPISKASRPVMIFFSEAAPGRFCFTGRGMPEPGLARPMGVRRLVLPWSAGAAEALRRHRLALRQESMVPTKVATLDDALALHRRLRAETRRWRQAEPAADLLTADIDAVLTPRHRRHAGRLREALARRGLR